MVPWQPRPRLVIRESGVRALLRRPPVWAHRWLPRKDVARGFGAVQAVDAAAAQGKLSPRARQGQSPAKQPPQQPYSPRHSFDVHAPCALVREGRLIVFFAHEQRLQGGYDDQEHDRPEQQSANDDGSQRPLHLAADAM